MKGLSERAKLSKNYTNHCIRSTCITNLDDSGFEARHITAVSGHKSETTIKNYSVKCPDKKKRQMSDALSERFLPNVQVKSSSPVAKKSKLSHTEPVACLDQDNIDLNIVDWVPIENNATDFDLGQIISEVEKLENQQVVTTTTTQSTSSVINTAKPTMPNANFIQNYTQNNANMAQTFPFLPRMIFPNSNVTINYNFNNK